MIDPKKGRFFPQQKPPTPASQKLSAPGRNEQQQKINRTQGGDLPLQVKEWNIAEGQEKQGDAKEPKGPVEDTAKNKRPVHEEQKNYFCSEYAIVL